MKHLGEYSTRSPERNLKNRNHEDDSLMSALNLNRMFESVQAKPEVEVQCKASDTESEVSEQSQEFEVEDCKDQDGLDFEIVHTTRSEDGLDEHDEPVAKWIEKLGDHFVNPSPKRNSASKILRNVSETSSEGENIDLAVSSDNNNDLDLSVFHRLQKSLKTPKNLHENPADQEESFTYSQSQYDDKINWPKFEDLTLDFEELRITERDNLLQGISKLRDSYLEASNDVLQLLKVLENQDVLEKSKYDDQDELDLSGWVENEKSKYNLKILDFECQQKVEEKQNPIPIKINQNTFTEPSYNNNSQKSLCQPSPHKPVKFLTPDSINKIKQITENLALMNKDLDTFNLSFSSTPAPSPSPSITPPSPSPSQYPAYSPKTPCYSPKTPNRCSHSPPISKSPYTYTYNYTPTPAHPEPVSTPTAAKIPTPTRTPKAPKPQSPTITTPANPKNPHFTPVQLSNKENVWSNIPTKTQGNLMMASNYKHNVFSRK